MTNIIELENNRRATPRPKLTIQHLVDRSWKIEDAVSELIDNSFGEGRGNAQKIDFRWFPSIGENGLLEIYDDGQGMTDLKSLFTLGEGIGSVRSDIGKYGSGGSQAIVWLASKVEVISIRASDGLTSSYIAYWDKWQEAKDWPEIPYKWETVDWNNVPNTKLRTKGHGTIIRLWLRKKHHQPRPKVLTEKIAERYAPALQAGKCITWQTITKKIFEQRNNEEIPASETISPPAWITGEATNSEIYTEAYVERPDGNLKIEIEAYLLPEGSTVKPGISIEFEKMRVIIGRESNESKACFIDRKNMRPYNVSNVTGRIILGHEWVDMLTTNKEDFNDDHVRQSLFDTINDTLKPMLIEAEGAQKAAWLSEFGARINEALSLDLPPISSGDLSGDQIGEKGDEEIAVETAAQWPQHGTSKDEAKPKGEKPQVTENKYPWMKPTERKIEGAKTNRRVHLSGAPRQILEITPRSNELMAGQLCFVSSVSGYLFGYINEDYFNLASLNDPNKKRELNLVVLPELAEAIASDGELICLLFPIQYKEWNEKVAYSSDVTIRRLIQVELFKRLKLNA